MKTLLTIMGIALLAGACSTLKLTGGGEKIRVLDPQEVTSCRKLGETNISVTARVILARPIEAITSDLRIVARNRAALMGGDTIVPLTVIEDGQQTFNVYKCVNPNG